MVVVYYIFAGLLLFFSYRSLRGGFAYLAYVRKEYAKPPSIFTPFATVIAPCKGAEEGLAENLAAVIDQDYPEFEVIFVVDDAGDEAAKVISKLISENRGGDCRPKLKLVVAERSIESGQKVENLREAVLHADPRSEIFVFVDSDARPRPDWLRSLAAPLEVPAVGIATGYRWFVTAPSNLATEIRSAWNASIASSIGPNEKANFCWGGSTAVRRDAFDRLEVRERWRGTVSDDFALARIVREAGLLIRFVPQALVASAGTCTFRELIEFSNRQIKITRVCMPHLWISALIGSAIFVGTMSASVFYMIFGPPPQRIISLAVVLTVFLLSVAKAWLRLKAVSIAIPQAKRQALSQLTLWVPAQILFLANCVAALFSRRITWRGIEYRLIAHDRTEILANRESRTASD